MMCATRRGAANAALQTRTGHWLRLTLALAATIALSGCVRHIYPHDKKAREYKAQTYARPEAGKTSGSLWSEGASGLFEDARARRVGDILTVRIDERSGAKRDASTSTSRESGQTYGLAGFFGLLKKIRADPEIDANALLDAAMQSDFDADASTTRSGVLEATLPVRIKTRMPNGDFFVEGNKVVLVNEEENFLYLSGVVREADIMPDNSVLSSVIADVELEYTGRGVLSEPQMPGWMSRILNYVWPF